MPDLVRRRRRCPASAEAPRHDAPPFAVASVGLVGVGPAEAALLGALAGSVLDPGRAMAQQLADDVGLVLELAPQRGRLRLDRLAPRLEVDPALLEVLQPCRAVGALLRLLGLARGAGEHALRPDVDVGQLDALVGEEELADLVGVRHPAGLEHVQHPVVLAVALHGLDEQPGVDERRDLLVGLGRLSLGGQAGEQRGDAPGLQEVDLPGEHRGHVGAGADAQQVGDRVHDDHGGIELADEPLHGEQVRLEAEQAGAEAAELQQAGVDPLLQVDADRGHVAHDLAPRTPRRRSTCARSPRRQVASQNCAASVDLPVPAVPLTRTVLPL